MEPERSTQAPRPPACGTSLNSLLLEVIQHLLEHTPHAGFFRTVIPCVVVTDYRDFVPESDEMHLGKVQERANAQLYCSVASFRADLQLIRQNAIAYNGPNGGKHAYEPVIHWATDLIATADEQLQLRMPGLLVAEELVLQHQLDFHQSDATVTLAVSPTAAWVANAARHGKGALDSVLHHSMQPLSSCGEGKMQPLPPHPPQQPLQLDHEHQQQQQQHQAALPLPLPAGACISSASQRQSPSRSSGVSGSGDGGGGGAAPVVHSGLEALLAACELAAAEQDSAAGDGGGAADVAVYGGSAGGSAANGSAPLAEVPSRSSFPGCTSPLRREHAAKHAAQQQQQQLQLALMPLQGLGQQQLPQQLQQGQLPQLLLQPLQYPLQLQQQQHPCVSGMQHQEEPAGSSEDGGMAICGWRSGGCEVGGPMGRSAGGSGGAGPQPCSSYLHSNAFKNRRHKSKVFIKPNKVVYLPTTFVEEEFEVASLPFDCMLLVEADGAPTDETFRVTIKAVPRQGLSTMYCMTNVMRFQQRYLNWQIYNWTRLEDGNIRIHLQSPLPGAMQLQRPDLDRSASLSEIGARGRAPRTSEDGCAMLGGPDAGGPSSSSLAAAMAGVRGNGGSGGGSGSGIPSGHSLKRKSDTGGSSGGRYPNGGPVKMERRFGPDPGPLLVSLPPSMDLQLSSTGYFCQPQSQSRSQSRPSPAPESPPVSPQRRTSNSTGLPPRPPLLPQQHPGGSQLQLHGTGGLPPRQPYASSLTEGAPAPYPLLPPPPPPHHYHHSHMHLLSALPPLPSPLMLPYPLQPPSSLPSTAADGGLSIVAKQEQGNSSDGGSNGVAVGNVPTTDTEPLDMGAMRHLLPSPSAEASAATAADSAALDRSQQLPPQQQPQQQLLPLQQLQFPLPLQHVQSLEQQLQQLHELSQQLQAGCPPPAAAGDLQGFATLQLALAVAAVQQQHQQQVPMQQQQEPRETAQRVQPQQQQKPQLLLQPLHAQSQQPRPQQQQTQLPVFHGTDGADQGSNGPHEHGNQPADCGIHTNSNNTCGDMVSDQGGNPPCTSGDDGCGGGLGFWQNTGSNHHHHHQASIPRGGGGGGGATAAGLHLQPLRLRPVLGPLADAAPLPHHGHQHQALQAASQEEEQQLQRLPHQSLLQQQQHAQLELLGGNRFEGLPLNQRQVDHEQQQPQRLMGGQHNTFSAAPPLQQAQQPSADVSFRVHAGKEEAAAAAAAPPAAASYPPSVLDLGLRACTAAELLNLLSPTNSTRCEVGGLAPATGYYPDALAQQPQPTQVQNKIQNQVPYPAQIAMPSNNSDGGGLVATNAPGGSGYGTGGGCMPDMPAERVGPMGLRLSPLMMPEAPEAALAALCAGLGIGMGPFGFPTPPPAAVGGRPFLQAGSSGFLDRLL